MKYFGQPDFQHGEVPAVGGLLAKPGTPHAPGTPSLPRYLRGVLLGPPGIEMPPAPRWVGPPALPPLSARVPARPAGHRDAAGALVADPPPVRAPLPAGQVGRALPEGLDPGGLPAPRHRQPPGGGAPGGAEPGDRHADSRR